ncbi:MAG: class I SAM-dependent methyltransferase, partial [Chloroflexota bacterium]
MTYQPDPEGIELQLLSQFANITDCSILEIGCGEGRLTWLYGPLAKSIVGVDINSTKLDLAKENQPHILNTSLLFAQTRAEQLPFVTNSF